MKCIIIYDDTFNLNIIVKWKHGPLVLQINHDGSTIEKPDTWRMQRAWWCN